MNPSLAESLYWAFRRTVGFSRRSARNCGSSRKSFLTVDDHPLLTNRSVHDLSFGRRVLLLSAGFLAITGPVGVGIFGALPSRGQSLDQTAHTAFEVSSVKPNRSKGRTTRRIEPGKITYIDITLGEFIRMAYDLSYHQISGPDWIVNAASTDRYDVIASAGGPTSKKEMMLMLRTLLADRFHLVVHQETRTAPMYALIVAKNGPKFKVGDGGAKSQAPDGTGGFSYKNWTMSDLVNSLSMMTVIGRPVLDRTGLADSYSFNANLYDIPRDASGPDIKDTATNSNTIFSTLQEQLGLKLESGKSPVDFLVVDHADKLPVAN